MNIVTPAVVLLQDTYPNGQVTILVPTSVKVVK